MWKIIEVLGKTKSKKDQIFVYRDDSSKHKREDDWSPFIKTWQTTIYQKQQKVIETNWYGKEKKKDSKTK